MEAYSLFAFRVKAKRSKATRKERKMMEKRGEDTMQEVPSRRGGEGDRDPEE